MGKKSGRIKRTLSVLLAAAMILTAVPQASVPVYAAETGSISDEGNAVAAEDSTEDGGKDAAGQDAAEAADGSDGPASPDRTEQEDSGSEDGEEPEEADTDEPASEQPGQSGEQTPDEPETGDQEDAGQTDGSDEADADEPNPEEQENGGGADADVIPDAAGTEASGDEETVEEEEAEAGQYMDALETDAAGQAEEAVKVRINIPCYPMNERYNISFIKEVKYKNGESAEWETSRVRNSFSSPEDAYVDISAKAGENLQFQFRTLDRAVIKNVKLSHMAGTEGGGTEEEIALEEIEGIYTIENLQPGSTEPSYTVDMAADFFYTLHFADVYADANGKKSVSFYQIKTNEEDKNMIGETLAFSGEELQNYFTNYSFRADVEEGYTLHSVDSNSTALRITTGDGGFCKLSGRYDLGSDDITVFVVAEPTEEHQLNFNIPSGIKDKLKIKVYGRNSADGTSELVLNGDSVTVSDDMKRVTVEAWLENDPDHALRAVCRPEGGDAEELLCDSRTEMTGEDGKPYAWKNTYDLGSMLKDGDVTVEFSQINMYSVGFHVLNNNDSIRRIDVYEPIRRRYESEAGFSDISAYVPEGELLKFNVEPYYGYNGSLLVSTAEDGSGEVECELDEEWDDWIYTVKPESSMEIYVTCRGGYMYQFDYSESDYSVIVYEYSETGDNNAMEPLEPSEGRMYSAKANRMQFRIMVKPNNTKWKNIRVSYESNGSWQKAVRYDKYDDTAGGYYSYVTEEYATSDSKRSGMVRIEGYNAYSVTVEKNNEDVWLEQGVMGEYGLEWWGDEISSGCEVEEGEELYFRVRNYDPLNYSMEVDLSGAGGDSLESYGDEDEGMTIYHFVPTADVTVTVKLTERKQHTVTVGKTDSVTGFKVMGKYERDGGTEEPTGRYLVRDGQTIRIEGICNDSSGILQAGYRGKVLCTADGETSEVQMGYRYVAGGSRIPYFEIEVTGDMEVSVDAVQTSKCTVTFADADKLAEVRVWEDGKSSETDNLYNGTTHSAELDDDKSYCLDFQLQDGYAAESVIMKAKEGGERRLQLDDGGIRTYLLGVPQKDAEITVNMVPGYTVKFPSGQNSGLSYYEVITGEGNEITNGNIQVPATENCPFRIDPDGEYKLSLDSDAFELKRVWKAGEYDDGWYQYTVVPVRTEQLPATVTVVAQAYAKHKVTMEYPVQIKQIYLTDVYGNDLWKKGEGTEVEVQGAGTVLGVRTISGYAAEVSMHGAGGTKTLMPFRLDEYGLSEYFIEELTEDVTISVTVKRSVQKQTYYQVGFLSIGNKVRITDPVAMVQYSAAGNEEDYENGEFYSVLKGSSISFAIETDSDYEVDGVYANKEAVTPVKGIYTVTPAADTQIRVDVGRIEKKYPVTFAYPDSVSAVKVRGYELQDDKLNVKAGTKLYITVELADKTHSVTSVTMNGKNASYNQDDGCYIVTTLAEAMRVEVATAAADKRVTFNKTVEHMTYSVETNEKIRVSETEGTYIAAPDAGMLRFTILSSRKGSVPAVAYVSTVGGRTALQAAGSQETETGISYSYAVDVSELPGKSEITIGETSAASDAEKAEFEKTLNGYKETYNKADYTDESWAAFAKALADAEACLKKADVTTAEFDAAITEIEKAAKALVKKGGQPGPGTDVPDGLWIRAIEDQTYNGSAFKPEVEVYNGEVLLTPKKDYTVSYKNNTNAGVATVTVNGKGNYKDKDTAAFNILKKDIGDEDITAADVYAVIKANGTVSNPKVTVKYGKKTLKSGTDYKVVYPELKKDEAGKVVPGTYQITITTEKVKSKGGEEIDAANYTGTRTISYAVLSSDTKLMSKAKITLSGKSVPYADRDKKRPSVAEVKIGSTVVPKDAYTVEYKNWDQAGKATIIVTAAGGGYYGSKSITYTVEGTKLTAKNLDITGIDPAGYVYTGKPIFISRNEADGSRGTLVIRTKGDGSRELEEGTDYTVSYKTGKKEGAHTDAGTVNVTITGMGEYTGTVKKSFKIIPYDLKAATQGAALQFTPDGEPRAKYTKAGAKPAFTLTFDNGDGERELVEKTDYTVSYSGNTKVKAGEQSATMTITGKGNFKGKITYKYEVTAASEKDVEASAADIAVPDQFKKLKTTVKVMEKDTGKALKAGTDYDKNVTYYTDAACTTQITAENFGSLQPQPGVDSLIYVKVEMKAGGSYAGTEGTPGTTTACFRLYDNSKKISAGKKFIVTVETGVTADGKQIGCDGKGNPVYTGEAIEPKVTVTPKGSSTPLTEGVDYKVAYSNNINKGKATAVVTAIGGGYGGSRSVKFTIVPAGMNWAEQTVKNVLDVLSELIPAQ